MDEIGLWLKTFVPPSLFGFVWMKIRSKTYRHRREREEGGGGGGSISLSEPDRVSSSMEDTWTSVVTTLGNCSLLPWIWEDRRCRRERERKILVSRTVLLSLRLLIFIGRGGNGGNGR